MNPHTSVAFQFPLVPISAHCRLLLHTLRLAPALLFPLLTPAILKSHCASPHLHITSPVTSCLPDLESEPSPSLPPISRLHRNTLLSFKAACALRTVVTPANSTLLEHGNGVRDICWLNDLNEAIWENFESRKKHWWSAELPLFPSPCRRKTKSTTQREKIKKSKKNPQKYFM